MRKSNQFILIFLIIGSSVFTTIYAQSPIINEVNLKRDWNNFRERDASVFKFNFAVSEKFFLKKPMV